MTRSASMLALAGLLCLPRAAHAQASNDGQASATQQPATVSALPDKDAPAPADPFKRFDDLALKGWDIPYPKTRDSILADHAGIRDALADLGIGISPINTINFQYDFLQNDRGYRGPQLYNGQNVTRTNSTVSLTLTYDLGRIGIAGGQLATTLSWVNNSFPAVNGPKKFRIGRLHWFQSIANGAVEVTAGYVDNTQEFIGINVGGNLATGNLGPQATIPFQLGLSYGGFAAPGIDVRTRLGAHGYNKFGVQRSLPPGGATVENELNPGGFRFHPPGTGVLFIDEIGYNRPAARGERSIWARGGAIYNTTRYDSFTGGTRDNWAMYVALDRQLTQPDQERPFRGIYAGATFDYAPPRQNFYTQYYEGRLYGVGLIGSRPFDLASLVMTYNKYSPEGLIAKTPVGTGYNKGTWALIGSYALRLRPGIYLQPGLGVTVHPIYSPRFGPALNGYLGLVTIF